MYVGTVLISPSISVVLRQLVSCKASYFLPVNQPLLGRDPQEQRVVQALTQPFELFTSELQRVDRSSLLSRSRVRQPPATDRRPQDCPTRVCTRATTTMRTHHLEGAIIHTSTRAASRRCFSAVGGGVRCTSELATNSERPQNRCLIGQVDA